MKTTRIVITAVLAIVPSLAPAQTSDCLPGPRLAVSRQGPNQLQLDVTGDPGINYAIERSFLRIKFAKCWLSAIRTAPSASEITPFCCCFADWASGLMRSCVSPLTTLTGRTVASASAAKVDIGLRCLCRPTSEKPSSAIFSTDAPIPHVDAYSSVMQRPRLVSPTRELFPLWSGGRSSELASAPSVRVHICSGTVLLHAWSTRALLFPRLRNCCGTNRSKRQTSMPKLIFRRSEPSHCRGREVRNDSTAPSCPGLLGSAPQSGIQAPLYRGFALEVRRLRRIPRSRIRDDLTSPGVGYSIPSSATRHVGRPNEGRSGLR